MRSTNPKAPTVQEVELKLALPGGDTMALARRLARTAVLKRRSAHTFALHNIYFDTPDQQLRQQHAALRLRRVGDGAAAHWLQTLKTGKPADSALSSRGEWEGPVAGPHLERSALDAAAWSRIDPKDTLFRALQPAFVTDFQRTVWLVRRRDRSVVEVALDIGKVHGADHSADICELEFELKAGPVSALFDVAADIAGSVSLLPLAMSKAQRGYALASDSIDAPVNARPPAIRRRMGLPDTARTVLREMFGHFTGNLVALRRNDDPEVVHQARVAWRRFRSARRLFKPALGDAGMPSWRELDPLLALLGEIRDLDVARAETLPSLRDACIAQSAARARTWDALMDQLSQHAMERRSEARRLLEDPAVGNCLLQITRWLDAPEPGADAQPTANPGGLSLREWAIQRATRLHGRLQRATQHAQDAQTRHGARILAKRTRYSIEALRDVLPRHITRKWYRQAVETQKSIGTDRDLQQAVDLLTRLAAPADIVAFLRGVAVGRDTAPAFATPD
jgi:inorganic triphosphatase YgiF